MPESEDYKLLPICRGWPAAKTHKDLNFANFSQKQPKHFHIAGGYELQENNLAQA